MAAFAHIGFSVRDLEKSIAFYTAALAPLGLTLLRKKDGSAHFGKESDGRTMLWIHTHSTPPGQIHMAFEADSRKQVQDFHAAALRAGGNDNGAPGIRENYSPNYYAAFVIDPDGHNIEAVCRSNT